MGSDHVELKSLQSRRDQADRRLQALLAEMSSIGQKVKAERDELRRIDESIKKLKEKSDELVVSEHAILRYLERVKGVDIEAVKKEILPDTVREQNRLLGNGSFPAGTHRCKIRDGVVITILTKEEE